MKQREIEGCRSVRRVTGGFIVQARWPVGGDRVDSFGDVVSTSLAECLWDIARALTDGSEAERDLMNTLMQHIPPERS